jgi:molybdopterin-guanine dinucleotide biosynthesis protein A
VPEPFLRGMAALADDSADVVVPRPGTFLEPLHALYARTCLSPCEALISSGERQIIRLYDLVRVRVAGPELLAEWDPEGLAFFNLNTPQDLARAEHLFR